MLSLSVANGLSGSLKLMCVGDLISGVMVLIRDLEEVEWIHVVVMG